MCPYGFKWVLIGRYRFFCVHMDSNSAGNFRKPVCKSANCGLKVLVCGFANRFLTANICGFAVKKLKSTANPQINSITEIVSAIKKKTKVYTIQCIDRFGLMYF